MIKAAFFDIDGTLVSFRTHVISDKTIETLKRLRDKGIRLFIASGRHFLLMDNLKDFRFDGYICMNGAIVMDGGEVICRHPLDRDDAAAVAKLAEAGNVPCALFSETSFGMNLRNETTERIFKMIRLPEPDLIHLVENAENPVYQYTIFMDGKTEEEKLSGILRHSYSTRWHPEFTDIIPEGLSKADGIEQIISRYGIKREEVIAFGDGGNDVEMLRYAGIGVAMGNAEDGVKACADYVTTSVDDEGVTAAFEHFGI